MVKIELCRYAQLVPLAAFTQLHWGCGTKAQRVSTWVAVLASPARACGIFMRTRTLSGLR